MLLTIQTLAVVAGVKRRRGRGNLGGRGRKERNSLPPSSLLPRAISRPNSLPLHFRTPARQAIQTSVKLAML